MGGKHRFAAADFIQRRQGSFTSFQWWDHFHFWQSRIVEILGLPVGRGEIPFTRYIYIYVHIHIHIERERGREVNITIVYI